MHTTKDYNFTVCFFSEITSKFLSTNGNNLEEFIDSLTKNELNTWFLYFFNNDFFKSEVLEIAEKLKLSIDPVVYVPLENINEVSKKAYLMKIHQILKHPVIYRILISEKKIWDK